MNEQSLARLDKIIVNATTQLFDSSGVSLVAAPIQTPNEKHAFAASIGFTAEKVKGALVMVAPESLVRDSLPAAVKASSPTDDSLVDWAGELANQLLGRLKNKLVPHKLELQLSIPVVVTGRSIEHGRGRPNLVRVVTFAREQDSLLIVFQCSIGEDFEMQDIDVEEEVESSEGDIELF